MPSYSIEKTTTGNYVVLNHDSQTVDFEGTKKECIVYIEEH